MATGGMPVYRSLNGDTINVMKPRFVWPEHCRRHVEEHPRHPMPCALWERIYNHGTAVEAVHVDDPELRLRESYLDGQHWRVVFKPLADGAILPISGHPIQRQNKRIRRRPR